MPVPTASAHEFVRPFPLPPLVPLPAEKELQQAAKLSQTLHSVLTAELATTQPTGSAQRIRRVLVASDTEGRGEADAVWCCLPKLISNVLRGTASGPAGPAGSPVVTPSPRATGLSAAIIHSHSRDFDWLLPACSASNIYCLVRDPLALPTAHCQRHLLPLAACVLFFWVTLCHCQCVRRPSESHLPPPPPLPTRPHPFARAVDHSTLTSKLCRR